MKKTAHSNLPIVTHLSMHRDLTVRLLRNKIRLAEEPDNPGLVSRYMKLSASNASSPVQAKRECSLNQFYLFIETMADRRIPIHWRCLCLDSIHQPLFCLERLAISEENKSEVRMLLRQLKACGDALQAEAHD